MNKLPMCAVLLSMITVVSGPAHGQDTYEDARRAVEAAQALQANGRWNDAKAQLADAEKACGTDAPRRPCWLLIKYATGYLYEKEAAAAVEDQRAILENAAAQYLDVLKGAPQHEPTLRNLVSVYRRLDRTQDAEELLKRAADTDRGGTGAIALLLGQFYREERRMDDALKAFDRAAAANPASAAGPQAIVALSTDASPVQLEALLPRLDEWANGFPEVAEKGYRTVLVRMPATPAAEHALLGWVSIIARQGWIAPANFEDVPRSWGPVHELVRFALDPESASQLNWWMQRPLRRSVLAEVALAAAQTAEVRDEPPRSLRRLTIGMRIAPGYDDYLFVNDLKKAWPSRMEIARAQLSLFAREPSLDPGSTQQRQLIQELFQGKAGAYQSENLEAMQRFHVTLGRWYAERREWAGSGSTNARFQLEYAINTSVRRAKLGEPYQPLQEEKLMLAGGYQTLMDPARARNMFLEASEAFLDTDQVQSASAALDAARRIASPPPTPLDRTRDEILQRVIATRRQIAAGGPGPDPNASDQAWLHPDRWPVRPDVAGIMAPGRATNIMGQPLLPLDVTPLFITRQRFKVWADLADKLSALGKEDAAPIYAGFAFEEALRSKSMIGTADLVRLEHAKSLALARADTAQSRDAIVGSRAVRTAGGEVLPIYLPTEGRATYVSLSADAVLAGRFEVALRREPILSGKTARYTVDGGRITLMAPEADGSVKAAVDRLQGLRGVDFLTMLR